MSRQEGHCLCGAVQVAADLGTDLTACHCRQCQRWTGGGPLFSVRVTGLEIKGEEHVATYRASAHGERAFCRTCGSALWWKMQGRPVAFVVPGLFDDQEAMEMQGEIFADHRPGWLAPWPGAKQTTEAEELAGLEAFLKENPS